MSQEFRIPKRLSSAILNSMTSGVVPRVGLEYVTVGRKREIEAMLADLAAVSEGAALFRFIVGRYGSGKSFLLQVIRNYAMDRDFIVSDVDLSPEKRLTGASNQGLATYRELMQRLSSKLRPDGGALEAMLQKWISNLKVQGIQQGLAADDPALDSYVEKQIYAVIAALQGFAHGFDFSAAISAYYKAYTTGDETTRLAALKWLRGEFATKTEAKSFLRVGEIIHDDNWYDYVKLLSVFCVQLGYRGLIFFIDEGINLFKIAHRLSRENNYEKILTMFNDTMQGKAAHLGIYMGATPQFIEDERRGLYSYEALRSRLTESRFSKEGFIDLRGPLLRLQQLGPEEVFVLLERLTQIHATHYEYPPQIGEQQLIAFLELANSRLGAEQMLTPREIARDFLGVLNILHQDTSLEFEHLIKRDDFRVKGISKKHDEDELKEFVL